MNQENQKELIKLLREITGLGMMECKRALMLFDWDFAKSKAYLEKPVHSMGILDLNKNW
jgi:translation elongation factor EF-Ts